MTTALRSFFIACVILMSSGHALSGIYTYEIRSIESDLGIESCQRLMTEAAAKFVETSGVKLISSGCEGESLIGRMKGVIVYSAPNRASIWSTNSTTYGEEVDLFYNRQQCQEALSREVELFQRISSLTPFLALCHKTSEVGAPRFRTRIDAVGMTTIRRYESTAALTHPLTDPNTVIQALDQQAAALGLTPVVWYQGPARSLDGLSVAYYAEHSQLPYRLLSKSSLYFSKAQDCEAAATQLSVTQTTAWSVITACSAAHASDGFQLNLLWWDQAIAPDLVLRSTVIPGSHNSLESCQDSARSMADELRRDGEKVVGIVCGRDANPQSSIKMEIISYFK